MALARISEGFRQRVEQRREKSFVLRRTIRYTVECDVFSYAVTLFEIATLGKLPFNSRSDAEVKQFYMEGKRDKLPADVPAEFAQLLTKCWDQNPKNRPTAEQVVQYIDRSGKSDTNLTC